MSKLTNVLKKVKDNRYAKAGMVGALGGTAVGYVTGNAKGELEGSAKAAKKFEKYASVEGELMERNPKVPSTVKSKAKATLQHKGNLRKDTVNKLKSMARKTGRVTKPGLKRAGSAAALLGAGYVSGKAAHNIVSKATSSVREAGDSLKYRMLGYKPKAMEKAAARKPGAKSKLTMKSEAIKAANKAKVSAAAAPKPSIMNKIRGMSGRNKMIAGAGAAGAIGGLAAYKATRTKKD